MTFTATVLTLYPEMFPGPLGVSLAGRALEAGTWAIDAVQIRDFAADKHRTVDDTPAGGGAGMVLRVDVLAAAVDHARQNLADRPVIALTPRGKPLTQARVRELADGPGVILLCGRFEGFDERIFEGRGVEEVSVGDIVLSGGEPAALMLLDACHSAASRRNGRGFQWDRRVVRERPPRVSALYPARNVGRAHDP